MNVPRSDTIQHNQISKEIKDHSTYNLHYQNNAGVIPNVSSDYLGHRIYTYMYTFSFCEVSWTSYPQSRGAVSVNTGQFIVVYLQPMSVVYIGRRQCSSARSHQLANGSDNLFSRFCRKWYSQEAQIPLRKQGVSLAHSFHHNATFGHLAFLSSVYLYVTCDIDARDSARIALAVNCCVLAKKNSLMYSHKLQLIPT